MKISEICIKHPVFTWVLNILLIVIGATSFARLTVRELPPVELFTANVETYYRGANSELVERQVTAPLEEVLSSIEGIDTLTSYSEEGRSDITLHFRSDVDINESMNAIRDKLSTARSMLPVQSDAPVVYKADPNSNALIYVSFRYSQGSALALTDYINRVVKPPLQQIPGVGYVNIYGGGYYTVRVDLDPFALAARHVTTSDIERVLREQNSVFPIGELKGETHNFSINSKMKLEDVEAISNLIVRDEKGKVIRLKDVAKITLGQQDITSGIRVNGEKAVVLALIAQPTANPVDVSRDVRSFMKQLAPTLPSGMSLHVDYDKAQPINASIHEVYKTIAESILLVALVVFAFLGSLRLSLVPVITIPVCLIAIFAFLYAMGYSINLMTLLALVLAIGLVVDDAIVMLENIHRHQSTSKTTQDAAIIGSREIGFAIVAMTITLTAVYAPLGFVTDLVGSLFREFAFTLAGAVLISGFVALTLSPMMCAYLLEKRVVETPYQQRLEACFTAMTVGYRKVLTRLLQRRRWIFGIVGIFIVFGFFLFRTLPGELVPMEDQGVVMVSFNPPPGSNFAYIDTAMKKVEGILAGVPEIKMVLSIVQGSRGYIYAVLTDWDQRKRTQSNIINALRVPLSRIPDGWAYPFALPPLHTGGQEDAWFDLVIQTSGSTEELADIVQHVSDQFGNYPGLDNLDSDLKLNSQQFDLRIDRELAANLKVDLNDIQDALNMLVAGRVITTLDRGGDSYDVIVQMPEEYRNRPEPLDWITVKSGVSGKMIPLSEFVTLTPVLKVVGISHYGRMRSASITASLTDSTSLGEAVTMATQRLPRLLPPGAKYEWGGGTRDFLRSQGSMIFTVFLALMFIYLVLAAQFESFVDPLIILLTVPFSIMGAVILLKLTGGTSNIYTQIGFITLVGLISKHGILITAFANQLQKQGRTALDAVTEAASIRLRPILMTTGAMVLGALPLALAVGPGSASRQQIGMVIVGGMTIGTFFSLVVVPVAYVTVYRVKTH